VRDSLFTDLLVISQSESVNSEDDSSAVLLEHLNLHGHPAHRLLSSAASAKAKSSIVSSRVTGTSLEGTPREGRGVVATALCFLTALMPKTIASAVSGRHAARAACRRPLLHAVTMSCLRWCARRFRSQCLNGERFRGMNAMQKRDRTMRGHRMTRISPTLSSSLRRAVVEAIRDELNTGFWLPREAINQSHRAACPQACREETRLDDWSRLFEMRRPSTLDNTASTSAELLDTWNDSRRSRPEAAW
jgi:hypothetical protein